MREARFDSYSIIGGIGESCGNAGPSNRRVADTAVAASAPRTKEAAAAPATRPLRDLPAGLSATRGVSMVW